MSDAGRPDDNSMDDILASIRRIISEEPGGDVAPRPTTMSPPAPAQPQPTAALHDVAPASQPAAALQTPAPASPPSAPAQPAAPRTVFGGEDLAPAVGPHTLAPSDDDVVDLDAPLIDERPATPQPSQAAPHALGGHDAPAPAPHANGPGPQPHRQAWPTTGLGSVAQAPVPPRPSLSGNGLAPQPTPQPAPASAPRPTPAPGAIAAMPDPIPAAPAAPAPVEPDQYDDDALQPMTSQGELSAATPEAGAADSEKRRGGIFGLGNMRRVFGGEDQGASSAIDLDAPASEIADPAEHDVQPAPWQEPSEAPAEQPLDAVVLTPQTNGVAPSTGLDIALTERAPTTGALDVDPAPLDRPAAASLAAGDLAGAAAAVRTSASDEAAEILRVAPSEPADEVSGLGHSPSGIAAAPGASVPQAGPAEAQPALASPAASLMAASLEDRIVELIRPAIKEWMDENMPRLVERALRRD